MQLLILVSILAGGVTFDVGRRVLMLVDEIKDSPVIRGLEHFGKRSNIRGPFDAFLSLVTHMKVTLFDLLRMKGGLSEAKGLEHYVVRAVEFRAIEYLSSRGAYVVDNLIVLGLIFGLPWMVTRSFTMMIVEGEPVRVISAMTAVIIFSVGLRILLTIVHARLFPGKAKS
jgi:hypothetical protein